MARRKSYRGPPPPHLRVPAVDYSQEQYRGYWIKRNALTGDMWIEKDGALIHRIPPTKSWVYGREQIDAIIGPPEFKKNPARGPRGPVDYPAATELTIYIVNDGDLYRQRTEPIINNLRKKMAKGIYQSQLALKLWKYLADAGAKKYTAEYGTTFNVPTRMVVAEELMHHFHDDVNFKDNPKRRRSSVVDRNLAALASGFPQGKLVAPKKRRRKKNPMLVRGDATTNCILIAHKGRGPRMHFDGKKFTTNGKPFVFANAVRALEKGQALCRSYPLLSEYDVEVSPLPKR